MSVAHIRQAGISLKIQKGLLYPAWALLYGANKAAHSRRAGKFKSRVLGNCLLPRFIARKFLRAEASCLRSPDCRIGLSGCRSINAPIRLRKFRFFL